MAVISWNGLHSAKLCNLQSKAADILLYRSQLQTFAMLTDEYRIRGYGVGSALYGHYNVSDKTLGTERLMAISLASEKL